MSATAKLFPISVHAECPAGPLTRVTARSFEMVIDEPPEDGAEVTAPFPEVSFAVELVGDASPEQIEILKLELARRCPVQVPMREAGSVFSETWRIARP